MRRLDDRVMFLSDHGILSNVSGGTDRMPSGPVFAHCKYSLCFPSRSQGGLRVRATKMLVLARERLCESVGRCGIPGDAVSGFRGHTLSRSHSVTVCPRSYENSDAKPKKGANFLSGKTGSHPNFYLIRNYSVLFLFPCSAKAFPPIHVFDTAIPPHPSLTRFLPNASAH